MPASLEYFHLWKKRPHSVRNEVADKLDRKEATTPLCRPESFCGKKWVYGYNAKSEEGWGSLSGMEQSMVSIRCIRTQAIESLFKTQREEPPDHSMNTNYLLPAVLSPGEAREVW